MGDLNGIPIDDHLLDESRFDDGQRPGPVGALALLRLIVQASRQEGNLTFDEATAVRVCGASWVVEMLVADALLLRMGDQVTIASTVTKGKVPRTDRSMQGELDPVALHDCAAAMSGATDARQHPASSSGQGSPLNA